MKPDRGDPSAAVCIIGAGPRGTSILERVAANAPEILGDREFAIHLVDPFPPGSGRTWRTAQSELLWMNSAAEQVTMFPDSSVRCAGPAHPGPTTGRWLAENGRGPLHDGHYASRPAQGRYLQEFFRGVRTRMPPNLRLHVHRATAVDVRHAGTEHQCVVLDASHRPVPAAQLVLAQGHTDVVTTAPRGLTRIGPGRADEDGLDRIPTGAPVVVRGLGLVFIDCLLLLTEGRGGRFVRSRPDGRLSYRPCGREPLLYAGSRRGVPPYPKPAYTLNSPCPPLRYLTPEMCRDRLRRPGFDFDRDLWEPALLELRWAYYHELFTAHPDRTRMDWASFATQYERFAGNDDRAAKLVRAAVPDPDDHFDPDRLTAPLTGHRSPDPLVLQYRVRAHLRDSVRRRREPRHSAHVAVIRALGAVGGVLGDLYNAGELPPRAAAVALRRFSVGAFLSSGPPPLRMEQLIALSEAGVVTFTGPDTTVAAAEDEAVFRASSPHVRATYTARILLDAHLPEPDLARTADPLLRRLLASGRISEATAPDATGSPRPTGALRVRDGHPVDATGRTHDTWYVAGPEQFPHAGTDAGFFRRNDEIARAVLGRAAA
ncbi:FAD/NAD(P)-binding protein [Streptomyces flavofungini]|uniref:FAD/NAD(P)-binding protein n=1 Tax=Streptomyces flavofungini TaxID=68200 RepID=A0ABS0XHJ7_9ACTN|nr:FAD/NAD(P)-binding protein [Streptomyces flavofungini]MBJ3812698.1 FAD/NAD(P)-binding protein [Streptomyces flavofungini]